jgi:hypothetical protein
MRAAASMACGRKLLLHFLHIGHPWPCLSGGEEAQCFARIIDDQVLEILVMAHRLPASFLGYPAPAAHEHEYNRQILLDTSRRKTEGIPVAKVLASYSLTSVCESDYKAAPSGLRRYPFLRAHTSNSTTVSALI